jgi:hypothetical protein
MNGGEITNNTGWNSNGVAVGVWWGTFNLNGGLICSNTGVYGPSNGRNSVIYLHSGHTFVMEGGTICHNSGRSKGGIDAPYENGTATINGGEVLDNISRGPWTTADVLGTSSMTITGGTFTQDVSEWLSKDTGLAYVNGVFTAYNHSDYLAEVQAKLEAGESVVLDRDIVITDYSFVHVCNLPSNSNGKYGLDAGNGAIFHITKPDVVLDLNGHSIIWDAHDEAYCNKRQVSLFLVTGTGYAGETASFTVTDSVGTGKVDIYGMPSAMYVVLSTAKATVEGGTWTNYPCATCKACNIFMYPSHGGALYITGGTFEQRVNDPYLLYAVLSSTPTNGNSLGVDYDQTKVVITGGTFVGTNPADIKFADTAGKITEYNACEEGFAPKQNADGTWGVVEVLLTVDGVPYDNWDEALENMKGNSFIKLYGDINNPYASKFGTNAANQTRTLDLNGHNFTSNFFGISASATLHVMDSVGGGSMKVEYIVLYHNGYLSLDSNVNFTSVININYYSDAQPSTGAVYIDGVKVFGRGHFSLEDGIVGNVGAAKITLKNGLADITLTSGNFVLNEDVITPADQNLTIKTTLTVNAGVTLTIDPATNLTISGNGVIKGEGTIAVSSREHLLLVLEKTEIKNVHIGASFELDGVTLSGADMNYTGAANLLNSGVVITAGTFDADVKALCPAGYCVPEENGVWTVLSAHNYDAGVETAPTYEADGFTTYTCENCGYYYVVVDEGSMLVLATVEMNGVKYPTIYDALNVLQPRETATIKFLEDYTFTADQRMFSNYTIVINAEYVTLDLNGKTITFDYTGSTSTCYASIAIYNKGTLTIMDSSEEKTGTLYSKTAIQGKDGPRILWITSAGVATIEGGNFISEQGDTMFYTSNSNKELPTCLYIKGGYFEHTIPTNGSEYRYFNQQNGYQKQIIEISGGIFKHNPTDSEVKLAEGFCVVPNADGTYGVETLKFKGARLLLKDGIGIYFMLNTKDLKRNDYVAVFTYVDENGETVEVEVKYEDWKHFTDGVNSGILFDGIVAKSITTEVSVVIKAEGKVVSDTQKMSVKAYAQAILAGNYADDAKELANALLNYGALAENAFASPENKTDVEEVNKNVNDQFTKLDTDTKMDSSKVSNSVYYGSSVNVESYLGFNFKFRAEAAKGATYAVITYGKNEVKVNITFDDNGLAIVTLNGLKASEADLALTCTLYDDNGTKIATATDSVYNYCARALTGLSKMDVTTYAAQSFKSEFYKSLVLYIEAAKNYAEAIEE